MEIIDQHCPICGDRFIDIDKNHNTVFLPNHSQFAVELSTNQVTHIGVCKKCLPKLKDQDHNELIEATKRYWMKEISNAKGTNAVEKMEAINNINKIKFKELAKDAKWQLKGK